MNNFGARTELGDRVGDAVIKTRAHRKDDIRMVHRHVRLVEAMHTQHAEELSIAAWISTQAHERIGHWGIQPACQRGQLLGALALDNATPRINDWPLGTEQHARRLANLTRVAFG